MSRRVLQDEIAEIAQDPQERTSTLNGFDEWIRALPPIERAAPPS